MKISGKARKCFLTRYCFSRTQQKLSLHQVVTEYPDELAPNVNHHHKQTVSRDDKPF